MSIQNTFRGERLKYPRMVMYYDLTIVNVETEITVNFPEKVTCYILISLLNI